MLVSNSEFKLSGAGVKCQESSFMDGIIRVFNNVLNKMIEAAKCHAQVPLFSIELALCVAQCMGKKQYMVIRSAGLV